MYLVQFKIKHFFTLQFLHNGFISVRELPMRRDLFVLSFYSRISRILDSAKAAAWKQHFYPFKYWLVPCSPRTSSGKLLTLITTSPKTSTFPFQCHCKWIPHLGSPFQQHQCCLSCTNVLWVVFSPCRSSNKFQVVTKLVLLWGNSNCTNRNPQRIFHLVAVSYNKWFAVAPLWVQLSVVQVGCAVEPEDWVNRAGFGSRQFTLRTLHMVTKVKYYS